MFFRFSPALKWEGEKRGREGKGKESERNKGRKEGRKGVGKARKKRKEGIVRGKWRKESDRERKRKSERKMKGWN